MTPATCEIVYADGTSAANCLVPSEIEGWAAKSNVSVSVPGHRIVRIMAANGEAVWPGDPTRDPVRTSVWKCGFFI